MLSAVILLGYAGKQNSWNFFSWSCRFPDHTVSGPTDTEGNPDPARISCWTPNIISRRRFSLLHLEITIFMNIWKLFEDKYHLQSRKNWFDPGQVNSVVLVVFWCYYILENVWRLSSAVDGRWKKVSYDGRRNKALSNKQFHAFL